MNIYTAITNYKSKLGLQGKRLATIKNTGFHLEAFANWVKDLYDLEETRFIRRFHLQRFQQYLGLECDYKPAYINQKVMAVNGLIKYLRKESEVTQDVEDVLECIKEPKKLPKVITLKDYDKILGSIQLTDKMAFRDYTIITLFMSSGIRVGGLHNLNVTDVDLEELTLKVTGKGGKERLTVFGVQCQEILQVYLTSIRPCLAGSKSCDALFLSRKKKRMSIRAIQDVVKKVAIAAGIKEKVTPHTFRRTFCTELIKADGNLYHIAQMLGHESLEHLKCYARLNIKPLRDTHKRCHPRG